MIQVRRPQGTEIIGMLVEPVSLQVLHGVYNIHLVILHHGGNNLHPDALAVTGGMYRHQEFRRFRPVCVQSRVDNVHRCGQCGGDSEHQQHRAENHHPRGIPPSRFHFSRQAQNLYITSFLKARRRHPPIFPKRFLQFFLKHPLLPPFSSLSGSFPARG